MLRVSAHTHVYNLWEGPGGNFASKVNFQEENSYKICVWGSYLPSFHFLTGGRGTSFSGFGEEVDHCQLSSFKTEAFTLLDRDRHIESPSHKHSAWKVQEAPEVLSCPHESARQR